MATRAVLVKMLADVTGAKAGIAETSRDLKRFGSYTAKATVKIQTEAAQANLDKLNARLKRYQEQPHTADVKIRMGTVARQIARTEAELNHLGTTATRTGRRVSSGLSGLAKLGGLAGVGYGVTRAITDITSATVGFDRAMRNVNSIAGLSEAQLTDMGKAIRELAGRTAQAPETLAKGLYDLVSSGFDAKQSLHILASSARAATAGLSTTEVSTKAVAAVLNAYHRPAADAAAVSDTLFQTVNRGVINFDQLASTIGDVLPFASSLGVGLNQVGAAVSTLTKAGISPEETMTRLKNVMVALIKPSADMSAAIKQTGAASGEALVRQKGFQGALEALIGTTDGSKAAVAKLFPNIRGLGGALALTGKNTRGANADLRAFGHTGGATGKALSQQAQSISYRWNRVKAQFSAVAIELGQKLVPVASRALRAVSRFVNQMVHGTGAGGRFARTLKSIGARIGSVIGFLNRHRHALAVVIGAWAAYRVAAAVAMRITALRLAGVVLGIGKIGPAVAEAEAASVTGFAGMRAAAVTALGPITAILAALIAIHEMKPGGDIKGFVANARAKVEAAQAKVDRASVDPRLAGFPDGGASTASGRPKRRPGQRVPRIKAPRAPLTPQAAANILAGIGSPHQVESRNLHLGVSAADRAYVAAVRKYGANSKQAAAAAGDVISARQELHDFEHPSQTAAARRRRRASARRGGAGGQAATPQDLASEHAAQSYAQAVRRYGAGSPQAIRARDRGNVATARATIQSITTRLASDLHKYGAGSTAVAKDRTLLAKAQVRLTTATEQLTKAIKKGTDQNAALLPKLTDVAYHPLAGRMQHAPAQTGVGAAGGHIHHHETTVQVSTPGGMQYPDPEAFAATLNRKLAAKGNG